MAVRALGLGRRGPAVRSHGPSSWSNFSQMVSGTWSSLTRWTRRVEEKTGGVSEEWPASPGAGSPRMLLWSPGPGPRRRPVSPNSPVPLVLAGLGVAHAVLHHLATSRYEAWPQPIPPRCPSLRRRHPNRDSRNEPMHVAALVTVVATAAVTASPIPARPHDGQLPTALSRSASRDGARAVVIPGDLHRARRLAEVPMVTFRGSAAARDASRGRKDSGILRMVPENAGHFPLWVSCLADHRPCAGCGLLRPIPLVRHPHHFHLGDPLGRRKARAHVRRGAPRGRPSAWDGHPHPPLRVRRRRRARRCSSRPSQPPAVVGRVESPAR